MSGCGGFGHAWNWSPGRWGFLWLRKGGHFWCYHCPAVMTSDHKPVGGWFR
jgi:hypothetical protein